MKLIHRLGWLGGVFLGFISRIPDFLARHHSGYAGL